MRRGGFLLFVILVAIIVFGYYRGWFTINKGAVERDKQTAAEKLKAEGEKLKQDLNKNQPATTSTPAK